MKRLAGKACKSYVTVWCVGSKPPKRPRTGGGKSRCTQSGTSWLSNKYLGSSVELLAEPKKLFYVGLAWEDEVKKADHAHYNRRPVTQRTIAVKLYKTPSNQSTSRTSLTIRWTFKVVTEPQTGGQLPSQAVPKIEVDEPRRATGRTSLLNDLYCVLVQIFSRKLALLSEASKEQAGVARASRQPQLFTRLASSLT